MKCINCDNETLSDGQSECKKCYDKERRLKIKNGDWKFNPIPPKILTNIQEQVLIGGLLGDTYLYQYKNQINSGIAIGRAIKDIEYLKYQFELFKDFCPAGIKIRNTFDKRTNKTYTGCSFRTQVAEVFAPYKQKWYPNDIKIVPRDLELTPLICAIWFCDDGSIVYSGPSLQSRRISLYTDSFSKKEVEFLQSLLKETIGVSFRITRKNSMKDINKGFYLHIDKKSEVLKFINYIEDVVPGSMNRKSDRWKDWI